MYASDTPIAVFDASVGNRPRSFTSGTVGLLDLNQIRERTGNPHLRIVGSWLAPPRTSRGRPPELHLRSLAPSAVSAHTGWPFLPQFVWRAAVVTDSVAGDPSANRWAAGGIAWAIVAHRLSEIVGIEVDCLSFGREPCPLHLAPRGRPTLEQAPDSYSSLSSSEEVVAVAVVPSPVGLDVQGHRPTGRELLRSPRRTEREFIRGKPDLVVVTRCRACKEVVLKAIGAGVAHGIGHPLVGEGPFTVSADGYGVPDIALTARFGVARRPPRWKAAL